MNVLAKIYSSDISPKELKNDVVGIIISGGPQSVNDNNSIEADLKIFNLGVPILGLCYGHQFIAHNLGGAVKPSKSREYGKSELKLQNKSLLLKNIKDNSTVWMSHGDSVENLPNNFDCIASTEDCGITAMSNEDKKIYGLQFHPEVNHSEEGMKILKNFIFKICKAEKNWRVEDIINDLLQKIKKQVNNKKVFILVSGGVDSSVAFALLTKALGENRVKGLYINNGFMRKNESEEITTNFDKAGFHNLETIDASKLFFNRLENIFDPEEKRKIIGQSFLDAKDMAAKNLKLESGNWILGQGTIYPDIIETGGSKNADTIKTHHNRIDSIQKLIKKGLIIEPLVDFYKDEVRQIGSLLGLSNGLVNRHPFPGPGLAIRCLCHNNSNQNNIPKNEKIADVLNNNSNKINHEIIPIKSVGVQGDNRTYAHPLAIWGTKNWNELDTLSSKITNNIKDINRVLLLLNPKEKKSFSLSSENLSLSKKKIKLLQEIDDIVMKSIKENKLYKEIWQFPVVLVPITNNNNKESIVLRPIVSRDAMTADFYKMDNKILDLITKKILDTKKISYVFYDITHKPPGTIEWE